MADEPAVTVVIPTRNRADLLPGVFGAILAQSSEDLEVIAVDDGSTDRTPDVIASAQAEDPRVRGVRHDMSQGAAAARNTGARHGRGRFLLFEDDDCVSAPDKIERLMRALEAHPEAGYSYGWLRMRLPDGSAPVYGGDGPWSISTSCALIRREAFQAVGGFDPQLPRLQDFDLFTRLLGEYQAVEVPRVLFEMLRGEEGISGSDERLLAAGEHLLDKYRDGGLPHGHQAAMHRRLGGKLLLRGFWRAGLAHHRASVRVCPTCLRSWIGWAVALLGPAPYRAVARVSYQWKRRKQVDRPGREGRPPFSPLDGRPQ